MNKQVSYILYSFIILGAIIVLLFFFKKFQTKESSKEIYPPSDYVDENRSFDTTAIDGKILFQRSCASCHSIFKDLVGPGLAGASERWPDKKKLYQFIRNPFPMMKTDPYYKQLLKKWGIPHMAYPDFTNEQIDAIFRYVDVESKKKVLSIP